MENYVYAKWHVRICNVCNFQSSFLLVGSQFPRKLDFIAQKPQPGRGFKRHDVPASPCHRDRRAIACSSDRWWLSVPLGTPGIEKTGLRLQQPKYSCGKMKQKRYMPKHKWPSREALMIWKRDEHWINVPWRKLSHPKAFGSQNSRPNMFGESDLQKRYMGINIGGVDS